MRRCLVLSALLWLLVGVAPAPSLSARRLPGESSPGGGRFAGSPGGPPLGVLEEGVPPPVSPSSVFPDSVDAGDGVGGGPILLSPKEPASLRQGPGRSTSDRSPSEMPRYVPSSSDRGPSGSNDSESDSSQVAHEGSGESQGTGKSPQPFQESDQLRDDQASVDQSSAEGVQGKRAATSPSDDSLGGTLSPISPAPVSEPETPAPASVPTQGGGSIQAPEKIDLIFLSSDLSWRFLSESLDGSEYDVEDDVARMLFAVNLRSGLYKGSLRGFDIWCFGEGDSKLAREAYKKLRSGGSIGRVLSDSKFSKSVRHRRSALLKGEESAPLFELACDQWALHRGRDGAWLVVRPTEDLDFILSLGEPVFEKLKPALKRDIGRLMFVQVFRDLMNEDRSVSYLDAFDKCCEESRLLGASAGGGGENASRGRKRITACYRLHNPGVYLSVPEEELPAVPGIPPTLLRRVLERVEVEMKKAHAAGAPHGSRVFVYKDPFYGVCWYRI